LEFVLRLILLFLAFIAISGCDRQNTQSQQGEAEAGVPVKGVDRSHKGQPAPDVPFVAPDGGEISLAELRGPMLVNLWATWCAPCVKELPTLNTLARSHDEDGALGVVAVSQDMGPQLSVEAFMVKLKVDDLGVYHDPKMALSGALGVEVMPTTVLYDKQGREIWRYVGDLDWTSAEATKLLAEAGAAQTH
jgi:thiol-disulfide isomerase/thioredoxin